MKNKTIFHTKNQITNAFLLGFYFISCSMTSQTNTRFSQKVLETNVNCYEYSSLNLESG